MNKPTTILLHLGPAAILALTSIVSVYADTVRPEILIDDFEYESWAAGDWEISGEAFGPGPAAGTLDGQMEVSGFEGERLVNSFHAGDAPTGTLTSPPFTLARDHINFLIGGGGFAAETCLNLLVDGEVVRTATGPNTEPGGSEELAWQSWDVSDLAGEQAVIEIVDDRSDFWGHITVDHIVQSDRSAVPVTLARELTVDGRYLHLPVANGTPQRLMRLIVDGETVRELEIELAEHEPDFTTYTAVDAYRGATLRIEVDKMRAGSSALDAVTLADSLPGAGNLYREKLRPRFHFTSARGWLNDPNGLVYYDGEYHLFFQNNPYGVEWGNMTWGHAVSPDLIHWRQQAAAIHPDELGTIFSGAGVVDHNNTTGWATDEHDPIVVLYTSAGGTNPASQGRPFTQSMAYSTDGGRTFTKYRNNPVLEHIAGTNRDPKIIWHEPTGQWIMILYLDRPRFALFGSPDLKEWTQLSEFTFPGGYECPDFFELPVDGDPDDTRWVVWEASGKYLVGEFDGETFTPETDVLESVFGANDYAAQTFSNTPGGRRIQMSWMRGGTFPGMPFNQQMTVPRELTLRTTPDGIRLFMEPVEELEVLRKREHQWKDLTLNDTSETLDGVDGELFDIDVAFEPNGADTVGMDIRGHRIEYNAERNELTALESTAPLEPENGRIRLRILVDRTSIEVFANDGRVQMANHFLPDEDNRNLALYATGSLAQATSLSVWELRSIWTQANPGASE